MSEVHYASSVAVVFINYMSELQTIDCLVAFTGFHRLVHITVVDNSPEPQTVLRDYCMANGVYLINEHDNRGYAAAANVGVNYVLEHFLADYIAVLNTDISIDESSFFRVIDAMDADSDIWVAGPLVCDLVDGERTQRIQSAGQALSRFTGKASGLQLRSEYVYEVPYVSGACLFVRSIAFHEVGLFKAEFFLYYEETEFCYRVKRQRHNKKVALVSNAILWHQQGGATSSKVAAYYGIRSRIMFHRKVFPARLPFIVAYALISIVYSLLRGKSASRLVGAEIRGIFDGLLGVTGRVNLI